MGLLNPGLRVLLQSQAKPMSEIAPIASVKPIRTIDLPFGVTRIASIPEGKRLAISSEAKTISIADVDLSHLQNIDLTEPVRHVAISSAGNCLAVVNASRTLQVIGLESTTFGRVLIRYDTPVYDVCEFSRDGTNLWCVTVRSDEIAEIHCYDARNWQLIGHHSFKPLIGGCGFILTLHPKHDVLGLWACGGPDEIWNYWIHLNGSSIELRYQPELDGANPPAFNRRGDRFAAVNEYDLASYSFPDCTSLYPPFGPIDEDEDQAWAESTCFLDSTSEDRVLASTNEGRLFVLSLESGEVVAEVALEGHEPKPCYQVYTSLAKTDDRLCSDLHWFKAVGVNLILSVHTNGKASNRQDTILLWQVRDL